MVEIITILVFCRGELIWMEKNQIDHTVVITVSQLYANGLSERDAMMCSFKMIFKPNFRQITLIPSPLVCVQANVSIKL